MDQKFVSKNNSNFYTIQMIGNEFNSQYKDVITISSSTVAWILKSNLRITHKKLSKGIKKTLNSAHKRSFVEVLTILLEMNKAGYELIYVDEFSLSRRKNSTYGWGVKGEKKWMIINQDPFSMSFIVAFSSQKLHGIMWVQGTIDTRIFGLFI